MRRSLAAKLSRPASFSIASSTAPFPDAGATVRQRCEYALTAWRVLGHPLRAADVVSAIRFGIHRGDTAKNETDGQNGSYFRNDHEFSLFLFNRHRGPTTSKRTMRFIDLSQ